MAGRVRPSQRPGFCLAGQGLSGELSARAETGSCPAVATVGVFGMEIFPFFIVLIVVVVMAAIVYGLIRTAKTPARNERCPVRVGGAGPARKIRPGGRIKRALRRRQNRCLSLVSSF